MAQYTQTYTFANGSTADGGQVNTEVVNLGTSVNNIVDAQVGSSANIAISKTALGTYTPWTDWTPTFTGFSGNPTFTYCRYMQIGKTVFISWLGNANGTLSTGAAPTITNLPVAPKYRYNTLYSACFYSGAYKAMFINVVAGTTTMSFLQPDGSIWIDGVANVMNNAWGAGLTWGMPNINVNIFYEVA